MYRCRFVLWVTCEDGNFCVMYRADLPFVPTREVVLEFPGTGSSDRLDVESVVWNVAQKYFEVRLKEQHFSAPSWEAEAAVWVRDGWEVYPGRSGGVEMG